MFIVWHTSESMNKPKLKCANKAFFINCQILLPQLQCSKCFTVICPEKKRPWNFVLSWLAFLNIDFHLKKKKKRSTLKEKFCTHEEQFFLFRADHFSKGRQNNSDRVTILLSDFIPIKMSWYTSKREYFWSILRWKLLPPFWTGIHNSRKLCFLLYVSFHEVRVRDYS